jgi:hypothetical protein
MPMALPVSVAHTIVNNRQAKPSTKLVALAPIPTTLVFAVTVLSALTRVLPAGDAGRRSPLQPPSAAPAVVGLPRATKMVDPALALVVVQVGRASTAVGPGTGSALDAAGALEPINAALIRRTPLVIPDMIDTR